MDGKSGLCMCHQKKNIFLTNVSVYIARSTHRIRLDNSQHDGFFAAPGTRRQKTVKSSKS